VTAIGIGAGLQAAWLLARGRADGVRLLAVEPAQEMTLAARSFWAAPLCLPALVCLHLIGWAEGGGGPLAVRGFIADLLGFTIGWVGFALLTHRVAAALGRAPLWPRFIAAWNWCSLIQYLMLVVASLPGLLGAPDLVAQTAWLAAMGWALWLEWFATRLTLALSPGMAAALVGLDVSLGLMLMSLIR
jgi:hypothetical protein